MNLLICLLIYLFVHGASALSGPESPYYSLHHHTQKPQSETFAWQRTTLRETDIHASGGIRNRNISERPKTHALNGPAAGISAVNLCLK